MEFFIFTVFTTKFKSTIPQKCWDIRINGIYKSKIGKKIKKNRYEELKIYIKNITQHVFLQNLGFTVFTTNYKTTISQNIWDLRMYLGIYKSEKNRYKY